MEAVSNNTEGLTFPVLTLAEKGVRKEYSLEDIVRRVAKGDKRAEEILIKFCYETFSMREFLVPSKDKAISKEDLIQDTIANMTKGHFRGLVTFAERNHKLTYAMFLGYLRKMFAKSMDAFDENQWKTDKNVIYRYKQLSRTYLGNVELNEQNAWIYSKITGIPIVPICQAVRARELVPSFVSLSNIREVSYDDEEVD